MSKKTIELRPISDNDLAFLEKLYASTREEELSVTGWSDQQKQEFIRMQFQAQHKFYQQQFIGAQFDLIVLNGKTIGRLYVERRDDEIRIIDIALLPKYRNKGLGGKLLKDLLDEARTRQQPIRIHVERFNPALKFYERLGFAHIEDNGVYYLLEAKPAAS